MPQPTMPLSPVRSDLPKPFFILEITILVMVMIIKYNINVTQNKTLFQSGVLAQVLIHFHVHVCRNIGKIKLCLDIQVKKLR